MSFEQEADPRSTHIAKFLRRNSISLWEPPYWENDEANIPEELVLRTAEACRIPIEMTLPLLLDLQKHALQRAQERQLLNEQGLVTVKIRIQRKEYNLKLPISSPVSELYKKTAEASEIPRGRIKLILNGRKLDDDDVLLGEKQVKNNTKIVGLVTSAEIEEFIREELEITKLNRKTTRTKSYARTASALNQIEITNQFGQKVEIPDKIKLDLTAALSLHDKGRFEMRRGKAEQALSYILEAERIALSIDTASYPMLDQMSNIPLINLDVVWCFLEIGSLNHLADGDRRLQVAEAGFARAYGPNMERVTRAKGSSTNEETLFVRLKLLQGVSAFYKADYALARRKFAEVEALMARLRVDEEQLVILMGFGYTVQECRIALRRTSNSVDLALTYLEEKKMLREQEYKRWREEQQGKYLEGVNRAWFKRMTDDVGVSAAAARYALRKFKDDYNGAVACAMEYECSMNERKHEKEPDIRSQNADDKNTENEAGPSSGKIPRISHRESDIAALIGMGIERSSAEELLDFFKGSLLDAENFLLTGKSDQSSEIADILSKMRRFVSEDAEDYLDSTLEKELECLSSYTARLARIESASGS